MNQPQRLLARTIVIAAAMLLLALALIQPQLPAAQPAAELTAPTSLPAPPAGVTRFAIIGDFGLAGSREAAVAALVASWSPAFIATTGDNNYPAGETATIDANIGQYYHDFIFPYTGSYGAGAATNRFFPTLGNHDWDSATGDLPYRTYFALPNNERYYDVAVGPVHLFMVDSDPREPDGISSASTQALWIKARMEDSAAPWKLVLMHHAPYSSSSSHGSTPLLQWPYQAWGADAVIAGHDHTYERVMRELPYFVNGLGGRTPYGFSATPVEGSVVRYNQDNGAMLIEADASSITFKFINTTGQVIDTLTLDAPPSPTPTLMPTSVAPDPPSLWLPRLAR